MPSCPDDTWVLLTMSVPLLAGALSTTAGLLNTAGLKFNVKPTAFSSPSASNTTGTLTVPPDGAVCDTTRTVRAISTVTAACAQ